MGSSVYNSRAFLRDRAVDITAENANRLLNLEDEIKTFASEHLNTQPGPADIRKAWPALQNLWDAINNQSLNADISLVEHTPDPLLPRWWRAHHTSDLSDPVLGSDQGWDHKHSAERGNGAGP